MVAAMWRLLLLLLPLALILSGCSGFNGPSRIVTIKNVKQNEFLYAGWPELNSERRYVLTWIPGFNAAADATGQWEATKLGNGTFTLKNVMHNEFMICMNDSKLDPERRHVFTWVPGFDAANDPSGQWEIKEIS
eukprot:gnl/TRDRNA2_/TRDRNA2_173530_c0_seq1.p1 gnl/TRDRNA2_/TRDRNA2_173530_c0~~gnl/TRDRNA2_/TRDRNA2_173530_c0_seq1.p1  ORF type:complete len:134 (+),score=22.84 gnl/TRDRNA2_/TRDRNA2_173530_c0_seq1:71-472(+)